MNTEKPRVLTSLIIPIVLLVIMWAIKSFEALSGISLASLGVYPQTASGLLGIITAPFVHGDWSHLSANSVSLFVLTAALFYFYREIALQVLVLIWISTGIWVWLGAREAYHIGASGIVYGLAAFLFVSGIVRRDPKLSALAMFVVFAYGSLIWGIFPQFFPERNISWESHLFGMIAGLILAVYFRKSGPRKPRYSWEFEELQEQEQHTATVHSNSIEQEQQEQVYPPEVNEVNRRREQEQKKEQKSEPGSDQESEQDIKIRYHYKPKEE